MKRRGGMKWVFVTAVSLSALAPLAGCAASEPHLQSRSTGLVYDGAFPTTAEESGLLDAQIVAIVEDKGLGQRVMRSLALSPAEYTKYEVACTMRISSGGTSTVTFTISATGPKAATAGRISRRVAQEVVTTRQTQLRTATRRQARVVKSKLRRSSPRSSRHLLLSEQLQSLLIKASVASANLHVSRPAVQ